MGETTYQNIFDKGDGTHGALYTYGNPESANGFFSEA